MKEQVKDKITIKQAARILQVKPDTIYHHIEKGHYDRIDNAGHIGREKFLEYLRKSYERYAILAHRYQSIYERIYIK